MPRPMQLSSRFRQLPLLQRRLGLGAAIVLLLAGVLHHGGSAPDRLTKPAKIPNDWFQMQRAWPHADINQSARLEAYAAARELRSRVLRDAAVWEPVGPTNVGGRIADVAAHPTDPLICYAGGAEGGVFKTTDGGATWLPTFDEESSLSIGSIAIDPTRPETVYVGTGEPNGGGGSVTYGGTGVFRTTNGGASWTNMGLEATRFVGRVVVDPSTPNRVFVAALGALFSTNPERGVYRSTDCGETWEHVLASTDSTGAIDVAVHPTNSDIVYAALWERIRGPDYRRYGGPTSGMFRSTDGGDTWHELTNGLPTGADVGRIGFDISRSQPVVLYAIYADADPGYFAGVYRTTDGGDSWVRSYDSALSNVYSSFGWWFGNIRVHPANPNRVFVLGLDFWRTTNGGASWSEAGASMHVDHHGLDWCPDPTRIYEGNDGGMYVSTNNGAVWTHLEELPATQFYTVEVDEQFPLRRYGGTQDNGTIRTLTGNADDWHEILGGDGFHCQVDPVDNSWVYAEWQYGNLCRSSNGGSTFSYATTGLSGRMNWSMPVILDPVNPATLYCGTDKVFRSTNHAGSWSAISPDLTDGPGGGNVTYGTITTLAVAPTDTDIIWAGTDDGNVHVTTNGGGNWTRVDAPLPERWITRVAADPVDANVAYVTVSGFRWDEPLPHVFRTTNCGAHWSDISSNLPEAPVNDIVVDPADTSVLYVATDFGVYVTADLGGTWAALGAGLPNVVVCDLELHHPTRTLVAGTYGRSLWTFDLDAATGVETVATATGAASAPRLDPVRPNPAPNGRVAMRFSLSRPAAISLAIYDVAGRKVRTLASGAQPAGEHEIHWDGRDAAGLEAAAGVYLVRLAGDGVVRTRKLLLTR